MRFRPLALFVLSAGLAVLCGDFRIADAQVAKQGKKGMKAVDPTPAVTTPSETTPAKPLNPPTLPIPSTKDATAIAKLIDDEVLRKLTEAKLSPSAICSDVEFLRRAYLDITGAVPSAEKAKVFIDSNDTDKRAKLLDELLADPNYGRRMADIWTAKLFPRDSGNRLVQREPLHKWFEEEFNKNVSWNQLVTSLITATGEVDTNPEVTYYLANRSIDKLTDTVGQHFLGIQIQCAQCHNHPFTTWKQTEYWGMATFFSKVKADVPKNANKGGDNTKLGVTEGPGKTKQKDFLPESAKTVPAKFLGGPEPKLSANEPYRPVLAKWLTSAENPYFSRSLVNRTWAHLLGHGFVNPVDDMLPENEPSHPALLDALAYHIGTTGFDLKYLIKAICLSQTYQRSSKPTMDNKADTKLFSHMTVKVMSPEQLFDSLGKVTGNIRGADAGKGPKGANKGGPPVGARAQFVNFFLAGAETASAIDYEVGIPQALRLMNSPIANNPGTVRAIVGSASTPEDAIERIYLAALSRQPTSDEKKSLTEYVNKSSTRATAYGDILWAVLNSSEFTLVR
ncbi:MAG TPA: DUF1549 and DUF1553 domain-containing protein [Gemmata sp.]|jgi:hypothetical protein|nr:DUF1549 and DUF1553 domain-containing protein [Gemmata sp.]